VVQDRRITSIRSYTTADGLASNWVNGIVEDRKGNLWLATSRGANRLTFSSPDDVTPEVRTLTVFDGLSGEGVNAVYEDVNGFLWFATYNGVTRYEPAEDMPPSVPPNVYITRVVVSGQEDTAALHAMYKKLPYQHQSIAFEFVGLSFRDEARVQYSYMLEGFDSTWSAMTDRRYAHYTHLPPGEYRFKVAARNGDGVWSAAPATFVFAVDAPLWARGWFVVSAVIALATLLWLVHRYRLHQALGFERVRLRIAADLHDDVGSTLSSIAIASEVARKEMAANGSHASAVFARINANARAMLERLDDIVWAINPANDSLDEILLRMKTFVADAMEPRGIAYTASFPEHANGATIPMEQRGHLYLIFKEAVNNIAKHSGCTEAEIRLELHRHTLTLTVHDNGSGFDPRAGSTGDGLRNMHRRAAALGGQFSIATAPGKGTTIRLIAPFT
jgi:signal transduction histidine kinase